MRTGISAARRAGIICGVLLIPLAAVRSARAAPRLELGPTADVPAAGLRFQPIEGIEPLPAPAPSAVFARPAQGGARVEGYDLMALWRHDQLAALYTSEVGRIVVADIRALPPAGLDLLDGRFVVREAYEQAMAKAENAAWTVERLENWVEAYSGHAVRQGRRLDRTSAMRHPCIEFIPAEPQSGYRKHSVMRLPRGGSPDFVYFEYAFSAETSVADAEPVVLRSLRSVAEGTARAAPAQADLRFQHPEMAGGREDEAYARTRARVIAEVGSLAGWWYAEMRHYLLASDLKPQERDLANELQAKIEAVRRGFEALIPPRAPIREVSVIRVFAERSAYERYVGAGNEWTLGVWMPGRRELVVSPLFEPEGQRAPVGQKESILDTAFHEAWHQYVFYALEGAALPVWFDEGHAALFEACRFDRLGNLEGIEENSVRLRQLEPFGSIGAAVDAARIMALDRPTFYQSDPVNPNADWQRGLHYESAYALVYFLRKAVPVIYPDADYAGLCDRIVEEAVRRPDDPAAAMAAALEGVDVVALQEDFSAFWASSAARRKAEKHRLFAR